MDSLLIQIATCGRLEGYPIRYSPACVTNPIVRFVVFDDKNRTVAKLLMIIYITPRRQAWEPKEDCIFVQSVLNVSGYKGLGGDLMRLVIHEAHRLGFSIRLSAVGQAPTIHKLYNFYEKLGFAPVENTKKDYEDECNTESQDYLYEGGSASKVLFSK
jgi:predicted N-acetyltransferase YhbS